MKRGIPHDPSRAGERERHAGGEGDVESQEENKVKTYSGRFSSKLGGETVALLAFSICSIAMINVNKACIRCFPFPTLVQVVQVVCTIFQMVLVDCIKMLILRIRGQQVQPSLLQLDGKVARRWVLVSGLFTFNLFTSFKALQYVNVPTFTVLRNCQPAFTVLLDFILSQSLSVDSTSVFCLLIASLGATHYTVGDVMFNLPGYLWSAAHMLSMATYLVSVKHLSNTCRLSSQEMSFYNNLLSLPFLFALMYAQREYISYLSEIELFGPCFWILFASCVNGLAISVSAFGAQQILSPTSFVALNNACKIPAIWVSILCFGGILTIDMGVGMAVSLFGAFLYALHAKSPGLFNPSNRTQFLPLLLASAIFAVSFLHAVTPKLGALMSKSPQERRGLVVWNHTLAGHYPDCLREWQKAPCSLNGTIYVCTQVPGALCSSYNQPSPHPSCLDCAASFGTCLKGQFVCACETGASHLENFTDSDPGNLARYNAFEHVLERNDNETFIDRSLACPDPALVKKSSLPPTNEDFVGSDYRLGNLIDRWYAYAQCTSVNGRARCLEVEEQFKTMAVNAPLNSFGYHLSHNAPTMRPDPTSIALKHFAPFDGTQTYWWIYDYRAIQEILPEFTESLAFAVESYMAQVSFKLPFFKPHSCVIHYRLGDMLSHRHFLDPQSFASSVYKWAAGQGLRINTFHVLASGNLAFRATSAELSFSEKCFRSFLKQLQHLFPQSKIVLETNGTPDEDWFKLAVAPMSFVSHGSFGMSAVVLNHGAVGTPAMENLNFPGCESGVPRDLSLPIRWGWTIFECVNFNATQGLRMDTD